MGLYLFSMISTQNKSNDPRNQALFKRCRHINLSTSIIGQDYYKLSKKSFRANGKNIIFSNQILLEMFKIYIKIKHLSI